MSLQRYILALSQFEKKLPDVLKEIIKKHEGKIVGLVKNRLYRYGVDGEGVEIRPTYSPQTIKFKKEKGQITSHVTLRDEGLFYKSFYLELDKYDLILRSSDTKARSLIERYGEAILHFTKQEKDYIINEIVDPELEKYIASLPFNSGSAGTINILD